MDSHLTSQKGQNPAEVESWIWESAKPKLEATQLSNFIVLNVGGTTFACSIEILRKIPNTYLSVLVSGKWALKTQNDGSVFIDRDPTVFPLIMTYMRMVGTGFDLEAWRKTLSKRKALQLREEAKFYMIPALYEEPPILTSLEEWKLIHPAFENRELLFQLRRDGAAYDTVISKVSGRSHLLVLARMENDLVVGGFTSLSWNFKSEKFASDTEAFLVSKSGGTGTLQKHAIKKGKNAILTDQRWKSLGFGIGHDLHIAFGGSIIVSNNPSSYESLPFALRQQTAVELEIWSLDTAPR